MQKRTCGEISGTDTGILQTICPSYHPTNSVKSLNETQSTDDKQSPKLIISSSTTSNDHCQALDGRSTAPLDRLSEANTS